MRNFWAVTWSNGVTDRPVRTDFDKFSLLAAYRWWPLVRNKARSGRLEQFEEFSVRRTALVELQVANRVLRDQSDEMVP